LDNDEEVTLTPGAMVGTRHAWENAAANRR
jgi:hypothetical protein